jgi:hypothetical protein
VKGSADRRVAEKRVIVSNIDEQRPFGDALPYPYTHGRPLKRWGPIVISIRLPISGA